MDKEDVVYIHTMEYYSAIKKGIMPFVATWMHLEIIILNRSDRERQISHSITHVESKKKDTNELIYKTEVDLQTENKSGYQRTKAGGGIN